MIVGVIARRRQVDQVLDGAIAVYPIQTLVVVDEDRVVVFDRDTQPRADEGRLVVAVVDERRRPVRDLPDLHRRWLRALWIAEVGTRVEDVEVTIWQAIDRGRAGEARGELVDLIPARGENVIARLGRHRRQNRQHKP